MTHEPHPRPAPARIEQTDSGWSIWLSPDATVVELAALMGGLRKIGYELEAHDMGGGAFVLFPVGGFMKEVGPPHAIDVAECISTFRGPLPGLRSIRPNEIDVTSVTDRDRRFVGGLPK